MLRPSPKTILPYFNLLMFESGHARQLLWHCNSDSTLEWFSLYNYSQSLVHSHISARTSLQNSWLQGTEVTLSTLGFTKGIGSPSGLGRVEGLGIQANLGRILLWPLPQILSSRVSGSGGILSKPMSGK